MIYSGRVRPVLMRLPWGLLSIVIEDPIPLDRYIRPMEVAVPSPQVKDRVLQESGQFVDPIGFKIDSSIDYGRLHVDFIFLGEEDPDRRIELSVVLKCADGGILQTISRVYSDSRLIAKEMNAAREGTRSAKVSAISSDGFKLDKSVLEKLHHVELTFRDMCPAN